MKKSNKWVIVLLAIFISLGLQSCDTDNSKTLDNTQQSNQAIGDTTDISSLDSINQLITKEPKRVEHYRKRAALYLDLGNYNSALSDVNKALQIDSLSSDTWISLADVYFAKQRHVDSREALLQALKLNHVNTSAMLKLAQLYAVNGDVQTALAYAEEGITTEPTNAEAHFVKSNLKLHIADTNAAIFHLHKATEINADYYAAWMLLGHIHEQQNKAMALQYYQSALAIDTNNTTTLYSIAMYYQNREDLENAEQTYQRILSKEDNPYVWYNLGYINMIYKDNYTEAIKDFELSYTLLPDYVDALYNWAYALELNGNRQAAISKYKEVLKKHTNHEKALERLNELL